MFNKLSPGFVMIQYCMFFTTLTGHQTGILYDAISACARLKNIHIKRNVVPRGHVMSGEMSESSQRY